MQILKDTFPKLFCLSLSLCGKRMRDVYLFKTFLTTFLLFWVWGYHLHLPFPFSPFLEVAIFERLSFPSTVRTELFVSSVSICPYPVKWILWFPFLIRILSNWGPEMTLISQGHTGRVKFVFRLKTVWCALLLGNSAQLHFSLTISSCYEEDHRITGLSLCVNSVPIWGKILCRDHLKMCL